jgi:hypothetical protein
MHLCHEGTAVSKGSKIETRRGYESIEGGEAEERRLIILQMMNYLEKYNPDMTFDKSFNKR